MSKLELNGNLVSIWECRMVAEWTANRVDAVVCWYPLGQKQIDKKED